MEQKFFFRRKCSKRLSFFLYSAELSTHYTYFLNELWKIMSRQKKRFSSNSPTKFVDEYLLNFFLVSYTNLGILFVEQGNLKNHYFFSIKNQEILILTCQNIWHFEQLAICFHVHIYAVNFLKYSNFASKQRFSQISKSPLFVKLYINFSIIKFDLIIFMNNYSVLKVTWFVTNSKW